MLRNLEATSNRKRERFAPFSRVAEIWQINTKPEKSAFPLIPTRTAFDPLILLHFSVAKHNRKQLHKTLEWYSNPPLSAIRPLSFQGSAVFLFSPCGRNVAGLPNLELMASAMPLEEAVAPPKT